MAQAKGKVGSLFFGMTLDTNDFKKKLKGARKAADQMGKSIVKVFSGVAAAGAALGVGLVGLAGAMAFLTKNTAESVNEQAILAKSLDTTTAEINGLILAGNRFAISQDMLIDKMREAGGIDAFKRIAEDVKTAGSASAQLAKAQELLGNEGLKLLPVLQLGADGLERFTANALEMGLALPTKQVGMLVLAWGEYEKILEVLGGAQNKFAAELALPMAELLNGLKLVSQELIKRSIPMIKQWGSFLLDILPKAIKGIFSITTGFLAWFDLSMQGIMAITEGLFGMGKAAQGNISIFETVGDILATLPNLALKALKLVGAGIAGAFQTVGNLILRPILEGIFFAIDAANNLLKKIPGVAGIEGLDEIRAGFADDFSVNIFDNINKLTEKGGLFDTASLDEENDKIIKDRVDTETKFALTLDEQRKKMMEALKKLTAGLDPKGGEAGTSLLNGLFNLGGMIANGVKLGVDKLNSVVLKSSEEAAIDSSRRAGAILAGSQEEARILNAQGDKNLEIQKKQVNELIKLNRNFSGVGVF